MTMNKINLVAFPGAPNLPIFAAIENGYFESFDLDIKLETTTSSVWQMKSLLNNEFQIAATAVDNVVAYQENQGAVSFDFDPDLFIVMGASQVELSLIAAPNITSINDLRGKSLALDALATGFAFVLYRMLEIGGLKKPDCEYIPVGATPQRWESVKAGLHSATLTIEPFTSIAISQGYNVLSTSTNIFDHYQGGVFTASEKWAAKNIDTLQNFIEGYLMGLKWVLDDFNNIKACEILLKNMPLLKKDSVQRVIDKLKNPRTGLTPRATISIEGLEQVLELRSNYHSGKKELNDPYKYIDLSYYDNVIKNI